MKIIQIKSLSKVVRNKKELETKLNVKLSIKNYIITIEGEELDEYVAEKVIEAIDLGFSTPIALMLAQEDIMLEKLNIKSLSRKNPKMIRARIIGTRRKTLDTIEQVSDCKLSLHGNDIGIIGNAEDIKGVIQAITSLSKGAKQANIYAYLEKLQGYKQPFVLKLKKHEEE